VPTRRSFAPGIMPSALSKEPSLRHRNAPRFPATFDRSEQAVQPKKVRPRPPRICAVARCGGSACSGSSTPMRPAICFLERTAGSRRPQASGRITRVRDVLSQHKAANRGGPGSAQKATRPRTTDMRNSIDRLSSIIRSTFGGEPAIGSLFLFGNKRRDWIKSHWRDGDGFMLWYKRREEGTFEAAALPAGAERVQIDPTLLAMILRGVRLATGRSRKRYHRNLV